MRLRKFIRPLFAFAAFSLLAAVGYAQSSPVLAPTIVWIKEDTPYSIALRWERAEKDTRILGWNVYRNDIWRAWVYEGNNFVNDWTDNLSPGDNTAYRYFVKADVGTTSESLPSDAVIRMIAPMNFRAYPSTSNVRLAWALSTGAITYKVERRNAGSSTYSPLIEVSTLEYIDSTVTSGAVYDYRVQACIPQGCSIYSDLTNVNITTTTTTVPAPPTNFSYSTPTSTTVPLYWTASANADKYNIYREVAGSMSWVTVAQVTTGTTYTDTGLAPATSYNYRIEACLSGTGCSTTFAYLNNVTTASLSTTTTAPSAPANLAGYYLSSGSQFTSGAGVKLTWLSVSGADQYQIFSRPQGGNWLLESTLYNSSANTGQVITDNKAGSYDFKVQACNAAAQLCSGDSNIVSITIPSSSATGGTGTTTASSVTLVSSSVFKNPLTAGETQTVKATINSTANLSNLIVDLRIFNSNNVMITSRRFEGVNLSAGSSMTFQYDYVSTSTLYPGTYAVRLGVWDSVWSIIYFENTIQLFSVIAPATQATIVPLAPTNLRLVSGVTNGVSLAWTDNATNEEKFRIERKLSSGTTYEFLTYVSPNITTYTDGSAIQGALYDYRTQACSVAGCSAFATLSNVLFGTVQPVSDSQRPVAPMDMSAMALSSNRIEVRWSGATDNVGVAGYRIFRDGRYVVATTGVSYLDSNVTPDTLYTYAVQAVDAAGNESLTSTSRSVRTPPISSTATTTNSDPLVASSTTRTMTTTTTTASKALVSVRVEPGVSFCEGSVGKTKMTFTAIPSAGAYFKIVRNNIEIMDKSSGTYELPNGIYSWQAIANSDYAFDHITSDKFVLDKQCAAAVVPTGTSPTQPLPTTAVTEINTPNLVISSPAVGEPVAAIATEEQYTNYCDDPLHRTECQTYAAKKIITSPTQTGETAPSAVGGATITEETPIVSEEVTQVLAQRLGVRMFQDTDSDGITDYDEVNIYYTDPKRSDTNGDGASDGDQLLSGTDPLADKSLSLSISTQAPTATSTRIVSPGASSNAIAYENPKLAGEKKPFLLAVKNVESVTKEDPDTSATSTALVLTGTALPNSFVTLYIFSDPIVVRVKADSSGAWVYTLDAELPDGTHEVVSAITDTGGRILAKSEAAPFVKTAAAVSFGATELLPSQSAPSFFSGTYFYLLVALLVALLLVAFTVVGMMVKQKNVREGGGGGMAV